jgi:DNA-binding NarL/FixJ family response regulator
MRSSEGRTSSRIGDIEETTHSTCAGPTPVVCDAPPDRTSIVLIDDDWKTLSQLREIIAQSPDLVVVAACRCADGTMLAIQHYRPALVILDVRLPDQDGVELIRYIRAKSEAKIIVFTAPLHEAEIGNILRNGADAIIFKDQPAPMLVTCVRKVLAGEPCILLHITTPEGQKAETSGDARALTPREIEVAQCAATGASNKKIARQLGISEGTVKLHLFHAYCKLRVGNRVELVLALGRAAVDTLVSITFVNLTFVV